MKKITKIIKGIFNIIDRKVIMPITRLVYKIGKKFSVPNKRFENWLSKPSTLLFISLFLAIIIFVVVDQKIITFSSQSAEVLKDQKVNVDYNEEQYVVEGLPDKVDVTLIGNKADLYIAKQTATNGVKVDLKGLKPGTHKVNIEYDHGLSKIEYSVNPSTATVIIYEKVADTRSLTYDIINNDKLDSKLTVNNVELEMNEISIRGAKYKIEKVATVKALIDLNELPKKEAGKQTLENVALKAYDAEGNVVDVEFVPEKISAVVDLASPSKSVPLNLVTTGKIPTGKAIESYTFSRKEITLYGDSDTLANINSVDVSVNVSNLTDSTTFKAEIKKPTGVKSMSVNYVDVALNVTDASSEPAKFSIPLTGINVKDGLIAQPVDNDNGFITVEVQGASSVLSTIDESDITAYVDLAGKDAGTYTLKVVVKGANPLATYNSKRTEATVVVSKKK